MPVYDYRCKKCRKTFTEVLTFKEYDEKKVQCPHCQSDDVERTIAAVSIKTASKT